VPALHVVRLAISAACLLLLYNARRRGVRRIAAAYAHIWILLTALLGSDSLAAAVIPGFLFGYPIRSMLAPWTSTSRARMVSAVFLVGLACFVLAATAGFGSSQQAHGAVANIDRAVFGLLQAWVLLAVVEASMELPRRWIRRASIRTKLIVSFGIFAVTPTLLAILFLGLVAWVRSGQSRAEGLVEDLRAHSSAAPWIAQLAARFSAPTAHDLAARIHASREFFALTRTGACVLERVPDGWRLVDSTGGPDSLFVPPASPVLGNGQLVQGVVLRARGLYWVESAFWPRRGESDSLVVQTFEPVDSLRLERAARELHAEILLMASPHIKTASGGLSIQVDDDEDKDSTRASGIHIRTQNDSAVIDSVVREKGIVQVGTGRYARRVSASVNPTANAGTALQCAAWDGVRWRASTVVAVVHTGLDEALGLRMFTKDPFANIVGVVVLVLGVSLLVVQIVSVFWGARIARFITRGVGNLRTATAAIAGGDFTTRVSVPSRDELGELATAFNTMVQGLAEGREAILERESLRRELELARHIQSRLLPEAPPTVPRLEVAATNAMSQQVGGDYYDFVPLSDGRIGFCVADVSGKGVGAALLMSNVKAALLSSAAVDPSPREITRRVNRLLTQSIELGKFVTFFFAALDPVSLHLEYVNAGHPAALLLHGDGRLDLLTVGGTILGIDPDTHFDAGSTQLAPGDMLALFTDGVTEAVGDENQLYGEERVESLLRRLQGRSAADVLEALVDDVRAFEGSHGASDDLTAMVLRVRDGG
jgi:serine phosphatase RsbU (regulator of sigma subunit)